MIGSVEHIESDGKHVNHIRIKAEILSTFHTRSGEGEPREDREKKNKATCLSSTAQLPSFRVLDIYTQECIGQGSFGTVYRAVADGYSSIALKITTGKPSRLQEELNVLRRVCTKGHLSLPRFEFGALNDKMDLLVIGMELCIPSTLHDLLLSTRLTNEADMLFLGYEVVVAIHCLHSEGCIHRDVKLQNFIFDVEGNIKLIDFGLAATTAHPPAGDMVAGTVSFMSPEMAYNVLHRERRVSVGIEADMWSLGIVLFSIFTQRNPYAVAPGSEIESPNEKPWEGGGSRTTDGDAGESGSASKTGGGGVGEKTDTPDEESTSRGHGTDATRPVELLHRVEMADWRWPEGCLISPAIKVLIESLLVKNPSQRPPIEHVLQHKIWNLRRRCPPAAVTAFLGVEDEFLMSNEETCLLKAVSTRMTEKRETAKRGRRPASCPLTSSAPPLLSLSPRSFSVSSLPSSVSSASRLPSHPHADSSEDVVHAESLPPLLQGRTSLKVVAADQVELDGSHHLTTIYDVRGGEVEKRGGGGRRKAIPCHSAMEDVVHPMPATTRKKGRKGVGSAAAATASLLAWGHSSRKAARERSAPLKEIHEVIREASTSVSLHRERSIASSSLPLASPIRIHRGVSIGRTEATKGPQSGSTERYGDTSTDIFCPTGEEEAEGVTPHVVSCAPLPFPARPDGQWDRRTPSMSSDKDGLPKEAAPASDAAALRLADTVPHLRTDKAAEEEEAEGRHAVGSSRAHGGDAWPQSPTSGTRCRERRVASAADAVWPEAISPTELHGRPAGEQGEWEGERPSWASDAAPPPPPPPLLATVPTDGGGERGGPPLAWYPISPVPSSRTHDAYKGVIADEQRERKWLSSLLVLQRTHCLTTFRSMLEEDQSRAHFLWLEKAQRGTANHPHHYRPCSRAATGSYRFGYVCDRCDYDYLPAGKGAKMFYYHCACGRDMCVGCFHAYAEQYTCPGCRTVLPNGASFRVHTSTSCAAISPSTTTRRALPTSGMTSGAADAKGKKGRPAATTCPTKGKISTAAGHSSTPTGRKGEGKAGGGPPMKDEEGRKTVTGKRGSPRAMPPDSKMSCRLLPVRPSLAPSLSASASSSSSSSRSSAPPGSSPPPLALKRSRTSAGVPVKEERHSTIKNAKKKKTEEEAESNGVERGAEERLGRVRRLEEAPWKPFAKLRATQEQTKSAPVLPTEEEREAFLHGPWVQSFYLYPTDAGEDMVEAFAYHIQHGRTGAIFLTPKVEAHSAVFSLLEHVLHVIQEVSIETQQDSAYTYPLLHAMGNALLEPLLQLMQDIGSYESNLRKQHRTPGTLSVYPSPRAHLAHSTANGEPFVYVRWFRRNTEGTIWVFLLSHGGLQAYVNNDYELRWVESEEGRVFRIRNNGVCDIITRDFPIFSLIEALLYDP